MTALPSGRRAAAAEEIQTLQRQAAFTISRRLDHNPLTASERNALALAARLLVDLGDLERAARTFERAGDELRAAEAYGALGDLDRMEACLAREEARRRHARDVADTLRRFDTLLAAGERQAALVVAASLPSDDFDAQSTRARAAEVDRRLCRGRGVSLRTATGQVVRLAGAPAVLGRDGLCDVVLRDPGVSRRHATIVDDGGALALEDLGSRAGTRLAGALVAGRLRLAGAGELALGESCRLRYRADGGALELEGAQGLDRGLRAVVGTGPLPLAAVVGGTDGVIMRFDAGVARLDRAGGPPVRVAGQLVGPGCDLLHGDVVDLAGGVRLEVL
jgi:hypothetical protein